MRKKLVAVHQNTDRGLYSKAARGEIHLFYGTKPMKIKDKPSLDEFGGEYLVPPESAMILYDMVCEGAEPSDIVDTLGLQKVIFEERASPRKTVRREPVYDERPDYAKLDFEGPAPGSYPELRVPETTPQQDTKPTEPPSIRCQHYEPLTSWFKYIFMLE